MPHDEEGKNLGWLMGNVTLSDLRLVKVASELTPTQPTSLPIGAKLTHKIEYADTDDSIIYQLSFLAELDPADTRFFVAEAAYVITFAKPVSEVSEDAAKSFGESTVLFAVYPYVRELLQTLTTRAGLSPLVLDLLRIPVLRATAQTAPAE